MLYDRVIQRIDRYLKSDSYLPVIVDLPNVKSLNDFISHYQVGNNKVIKSSRFCSKDSLPVMDKLVNDLSLSNDTVFLEGLSLFLKLQGETVLIDVLNSLMQLSCSGKLVIITLGCSKWLSNFDARYFQSGRISVVEGELEELPALCFIAPELPKPDRHLLGINNLPQFTTLFEEGNCAISIITYKSKRDFSNSLFEICEYSSNYQVIKDAYVELSAIGKETGTDEQWTELIGRLENVENFGELVEQLFGSVSSLAHSIDNFSTFDPFTKWLYFLALRVYGAKDNDYLANVITKSSTYQKFITNCYNFLLHSSVKDTNFLLLYKQRKSIVSQLKDHTDEVVSYCKQAYGKKEDALYFLTDVTIVEKEMVIELLSMYEYSSKEMSDILKVVYPDLALYLLQYDYGNEYLNEYFASYKLCKVTNKISEAHMDMVMTQAIERQYNSWLPARTVCVDSLKKDAAKTPLYFMDALGVEYLSYLQNKCFDSGLAFHSALVRCELPSITCLNKEFVEEFKNLGCKIYDNKELDELKHGGQNTYNYENSKLPLHIVKELEILDALVQQLKTIDKDQVAYVIADHGASRLAVINEKENKWEVSEKGQHSGRCCPKSDVSEKPDMATEENDFWCLANYDRFKGGRKAIVEVHGGASLEEVVVPVIDIKKITKGVACKFVDDKPVMVSFNKKAKVRIFVEIKSDNLSVSVNGKYYPLIKSDVPYHYSTEMPDVKSAGSYKLNVFSDGVLICKDLVFEVKKEGASERKFF